uniref:SCP domain-containing protein n=1 Tax=Caenorhabditis japonica TaxID=281687 RepID=A0A8R1HP53_CAEJA
MTIPEEGKEFIDQILQEHNTRRQRHGAPELEYNTELSEMAQQWAEKLAKQKTNPSLNRLLIVPFFVVSVVEHWYQEHEKYEYETPGWQTGTNYFTQVIWRSTKEIGVGCAYVKKSHENDEDNTSCSNGSVCKSMTSLSSNGKLAADGDKVIVAFYRPAGNNNRSGQFAANVLKPL